MKLKARIYDKRRQQMIYSGKLEEQGKREYFPLVFEIGFSHWKESDLSEPMVFTGQRDGSGEDGYAGDLVKMFNRSLYLIAWDDCYARFQLEFVNGHELRGIYDMGMLQMGEIVGNIYEHPDLLKA